MIDISSIKKQLKSSDEELRIKSLVGLEGCFDDDAIDLLISSLSDESWRVRKIAVEYLSGFADTPKILPLLINCLRSEDNAGLRNAALETLENIGTPAVDSLIPYIADDDSDLRKQTLDILGAIGNKKVVPYIIQALSDPDDNVRSAAAENLGKIGDDVAVRSLIDALKKEDLLLNLSALEALSRIGGAVPIEDIKPLIFNPLLKKISMVVLGNSLDINAIPMLIDGLETGSKAVKEAAVTSIVQLVESLSLKDEAITLIADKKSFLPDLIFPCLDSNNTLLSISALRLLGWMKSVDSIPKMLAVAANDELAPVVFKVIKGFDLQAEKYLMASYEGSSDEIKPLICRLLGEIGSIAAVDFLIDALQSDIGHVRHLSASSLAKIGDKRAIKPIVSLLDDEYVDVQSAAVKGLSELAESDRGLVSGFIKEGLMSETILIRRNSIKIQASMGANADVGIALSALRDEDAVVRKNALDSLGAIGGEDAIAKIILALSDEDKEVRLAAAMQLGLMKCKDGLKPLLSLIEDEDIWVRVAAIKSISEIGGLSSAHNLADLLDDEFGLTVITSLEALGRLKAVSYAPLMMQKMQSDDSEIVKAAIESLAFWDDKTYLAALKDMLDSENWEIRLSAVRVLAAKGENDFLRKVLEIEENELIKKTVETAFRNADDS